jgi:hypothetical protein
MPAVGFLTPEAGVPYKTFPMNRSQHDHNQTHRSQLGQHAEHNAEAAGHFGGAQENRKTLAQADAPGPRFGILEIIPAAGDEDRSQHDPKRPRIERVEETWRLPLSANQRAAAVTL